MEAEAQTTNPGTAVALSLSKDSSGDALMAQYSPTVELALSTVIDCDELYALAVQQGQEVKTALTAVKLRQKQSLEAVKAVETNIRGIYSPTILKLEQAETAIKKALTDYSQQKQREAAAETARLQALAEQERKLAAERAAEAQRTAEAQLAAARSTEDLQKASEAVADAAALTAMSDGAGFVAPVVKSAAPAVKGATQRTTWSAEVTNIVELIQHVAKHPELAHYLIADTSQLNALARKLQDKLELPGVKAVPTVNTAIRTK